MNLFCSVVLCESGGYNTVLIPKHSNLLYILFFSGRQNSSIYFPPLSLTLLCVIPTTVEKWCTVSEPCIGYVTLLLIILSIPPTWPIHILDELVMSMSTNCIPMHPWMNSQSPWWEGMALWLRLSQQSGSDIQLHVWGWLWEGGRIRS